MKSKNAKQYFAGIVEATALELGGDAVSMDCSGDGACGSTCGCSGCSDE